MRTDCSFRSVTILMGIAVLTLFLGGCGWFSKTKAPSEATAPQSEPAPAPTPAPAPLPPPPPAPAPPPPAAEPVPPKPAAGRIADETMLRGLVQGKTTKAEVRERFGVPQEVVMSSSLETFIYYRDRTSGFFSRTAERIEALTVRFDLKGILKDFEYRYSGK